MKTALTMMNSHPVLAGLILIALAFLAVTVMAPAMAQAAHNLKDAALKVTKALPNGAATIYSDGIDTGTSSTGSNPGTVEYLLTAPALVVGDLANGDTMKYSILIDTVAPIDGSSTVLMPDVIVQTGAGGVGAAGNTYRFRLPSTATAIVGVRAINSGAGDASDKSLTLEVLA